MPIGRRSEDMLRSLEKEGQYGGVGELQGADRDK